MLFLLSYDVTNIFFLFFYNNLHTVWWIFKAYLIWCFNLLAPLTFMNRFLLFLIHSCLSSIIFTCLSWFQFHCYDLILYPISLSTVVQKHQLYCHSLDQESVQCKWYYGLLEDIQGALFLPLCQRDNFII